MMLNGFGSGSRSGVLACSVGVGLAVLGALAGLATGCLDRPVAESSPTTSNVFVDQVVQSSVDKIDLLFMIDNSASMSDKQEILKSAVPVLVNRLTSPICVDAITGVPSQENSAQGKCKNGKPEFPPIADIHVGIITSSLGSHGGQVCSSGKPGDTLNDQAHLLGTVRPASNAAAASPTFDVSQTWNNSGFLAWDPNQKDQPPGARDAAMFQQSFQDMISAAGERGCGFEASLESWYRFLIDPEPPANVSKDTNHPARTARGSQLVFNADGSTTCAGCDLDLLAQRKAFLRPDSLLAIVMLSDENDCSIRDDGQGWLVGDTGSSDQPFFLPKPTAACAANPNDSCCRSCGSDETSPPPGCAALSADPGCTAPATQPEDVRDATNLRCYKQKQRFGFDLLYPTSRYVNALTNATLILQSDGKTQVPNPLFDAAGTGKSLRGSGLVFLAGIVGVPWQDIADEPSLTGPGLTYLNAVELVAKDRWAVLLGDPGASPPVPPSDPFMVESPAPRSGVNPVTGDAIMPPSSTSPSASPINGHEQNVPKLDDLQYACTFPLAVPKPCAVGDTACDCDASKASVSNSPLCQGAAANEQSYAKAYPGARELQVLKDFKEQGIVASIWYAFTVPEGSESPRAVASGRVCELRLDS